MRQGLAEKHILSVYQNNKAVGVVYILQKKCVNRGSFLHMTWIFICGIYNLLLLQSDEGVLQFYCDIISSNAGSKSNRFPNCGGNVS